MGRRILIGGMIVGVAALLGFDWWYHLHKADVARWSELMKTLTKGGKILEGPGETGVSPKDVVQIVISIAVLVPSLLMILSSKYQGSDKHRAYATMGTLLAFWLKS